MTVKIVVDLRAEFGPVRDQGQRPTCLAFAASDAHAGMRADWDALSCEYAFYHAHKRRGRSPAQGSYLEDMLAALRNTGQPAEEGWPYLAQTPTDLSNYHPPAFVGPLFGRDGHQPNYNVKRACQTLDAGDPAIVLSVLTSTFFNPPADGVIDHFDNDAVFPIPRHALVAVGYGDAPQGRVLLLRNSWGPTWGLSGYGWVTENFLTRHMYDLAILKDDLDVSQHSAAA